MPVDAEWYVGDAWIPLIQFEDPESSERNPTLLELTEPPELVAEQPGGIRHTVSAEPVHGTPKYRCTIHLTLPGTWLLIVKPHDPFAKQAIARVYANPLP